MSNEKRSLPQQKMTWETYAEQHIKDTKQRIITKSVAEERKRYADQAQKQRDAESTEHSLN